MRGKSFNSLELGDEKSCCLGGNNWGKSYDKVYTN
jgi:hypothetical protein